MQHTTTTRGQAQDLTRIALTDQERRVIAAALEGIAGIAGTDLFAGTMGPDEIEDLYELAGKVRP